MQIKQFKEIQENMEETNQLGIQIQEMSAYTRSRSYKETGERPNKHHTVNSNQICDKNTNKGN